MNMQKIIYLLLHTLVLDVLILANSIQTRKHNVGIPHAWECVSHPAIHLAQLHALVDVLIMLPKIKESINPE